MTGVNSICKSFVNTTVLQDVTLGLEYGKITGLYGESGCGKSTLAKILCGVVKPDKGEIIIDGKVVCADKVRYDRKLGKKIQIVYQQPYASLDPTQRIGSSLMEIVSYNKLGGTKEERKTIVESMAREMGLKSETLSALPSAISGGEAQRVAIAKCLLLSPKLLILDEATSMLDVSTQANVLGKIKELVSGGEIGVLFISHDKDLVEHFCDRIYRFKDHTLEDMQSEEAENEQA